MANRNSYFFNAIKRFAEETPVEIAAETAKMTRGIFNTVIDYSPILSGRFVGNWQFGPTDVGFSTLDKSTWLAKQAEVNALFTTEYFLKYDKAYMINNVDYAKNVEELGWQKTVAYAPVGKTLGKFSGGIA